MAKKIHKFAQNGLLIVLDINSGAVHTVDQPVYDALDIFHGQNDEETREALRDKYPAAEVEEVLTELHELMRRGELFAPDIHVPNTFKERGVIKSLCLMVAQDCNLRCRYCFGEGGSYGQERRIMTPEVGKKAVDFLLAEAGSRRRLEIDFFGGEPLLNMPTVKAVTEYVRAVEKERDKTIKLTLTTNGLLLNDDNINWLNEHHISVVLSLDGRRETHDRMRPDAGGNGSYDRAVKNFQKLVASRQGDNYYLRGTYTRENLDFTADVLAMQTAGFDILSMEPVVLKDSPLALRDEDLPLIYAEYDRLTEVYLTKKRQGQGFFFFHFNVDLSGGPCVAKRLAGCGAGHEYLAVAENGDLYPCHQFVGRDKYRLGSIFTGVTEKNLPTYFRQSHVLNKETCPDCWARFFCSGGCHANADLFNGDIRKPYRIGCAIQQKRLECAIAVAACQA